MLPNQNYPTLIQSWQMPLTGLTPIFYLLSAKPQTLWHQGIMQNLLHDRFGGLCQSQKACQVHKAFRFSPMAKPAMTRSSGNKHSMKGEEARIYGLSALDCQAQL